MRKFFFLWLGVLLYLSAFCQTESSITGDSIHLRGVDNNTAELILHNATQDVKGFLYNKGEGRMEFRKGVIKLNDSAYLIGADTLIVKAPGASGNQWTTSSSDIYFNIGKIGVGTVSPVARIHSLATTEQLRLAYDTSNYTSFTTTSSGTLNIAPSASNMSITGALAVIGTFSTSGIGTNANLAVAGAGNSFSNITTSTHLFSGASTVAYRVGIRGNGTGIATTGGGYASFLMGTEAVGIPASGTNALFAQQVIKPLSINASTGTGVLANSASLYIENAATGATNNYALWVDAGTSKFDGNVQIEGSLSLPATPYALFTGGATSGGTMQQVASVGTTGQVLTSNGAGALPTFQTIALPPRTSQTLASSASITWNFLSGYNAKITLGINATLNITNATAGDYGTLVVTQDATGGRTLTLPTGSKVIGYWGSGTNVSLSTAQGATDILNFYFDGTSYFWTLGKNYQ